MPAVVIRALAQTLLLMAGVGTCWAATEAALITATQGKVTWLAEGVAPLPIEAFIKLKPGDVLKLERNSALKLVFFENGRQETWAGEGQVAIEHSQGRAIGLPAPEIKQLSPVQVKQIAKTPNSQGHIGAGRTRALATPEAISKLENEYDRMRVERGGNDLNAEIFLLAGLFEMREFERVEVVLSDLEARQKHNSEAKLLVTLYRKALSGARRSR